MDWRPIQGDPLAEGRALFKQKRYSEAEERFQQSVDEKERTLEKDHPSTFYSKYWLGNALYNQKKYSDAEGLLQQAAAGQELKLGEGHPSTLYSKHWLGHALYRQGKYSKAEELFQQAADGQERRFGKDNENTLYSKHWLGCTLYKQKKYSDAEVLFQQATDGRERRFGKDNENTLSSKDWLRRTLDKQKKFIREIPGRDDTDAIALVQMSPPLLTSNDTQQTPAGRLESFFPKDQDRRDAYTDSEINEISSLLSFTNPQWSKLPRTYIVLRTIGHLDLLQDVIDAGFSDFWFPVTVGNLPGCLSPSVCKAFFNAQHIVLAKSMNLEKGEKGKHCNFKEGEPFPFEERGFLGNGGCGEVDKVFSKISCKEYARKRVRRSIAFRGLTKERMKQFINEIQLLKRLKHHHIVELVGSYTDNRYIALIMTPVAEMDLKDYLKCCDVSKYRELRKFFGCLAGALEFLHQQEVRHKDIKPGNILVHRGKIFFADFGLSLDFTDASGSTTTGMTNGGTLRYMAPEVVNRESRNSKSDIWSLGVVFVEMAVILKGMNTGDMDAFLIAHGSQEEYIRANMAAFSEFVAMLEGAGEPSDNIVFGWTRQMLREDKRLRPTASSLVASITEGTSVGFCGICCSSPDEELSDLTDE